MPELILVVRAQTKYTFPFLQNRLGYKFLLFFFIGLCLSMRRRGCLFTYDFPQHGLWFISFRSLEHFLLNELLATQEASGCGGTWVFSCSLLRESSCFSPQNMKCFCLTQFVVLSISYLGKMVVSGRMWIQVVGIHVLKVLTAFKTYKLERPLEVICIISLWKSSFFL